MQSLAASFLLCFPSFAYTFNVKLRDETLNPKPLHVNGPAISKTLPHQLKRTRQTLSPETPIYNIHLTAKPTSLGLMNAG